MIWFLVGLWVGAPIGYFTCALMTATKRADGSTS